MSNQTTIFCVDEFWNENIFDGNISGLPVFTDCFQHTALIGIPCAFFWLLLPILLVQLRISTGPVLPWTTLMSIKSILTIILICDRLFVITWAITQSFLDDHIEPIINFVYPCVQLVTLIGLWLAKNECRRRGIRSSGVLFCSWLLFAVMGIPEFYAWIKLGTEPATTAQLDTARYVAYLVWYPICLLQLLAFCWSDPTGWKSKYNDPDSPEETASFLNRQSFWWFNGMVALGKRKPLEVNDLFKLRTEMTAKVMDEEWERMWQEAMVDYKAKHKVYKESRAYVSLVDAKTPLLGSEKKSYGSTVNVNAPPDEDKPEPPSIIWRLFLLCRWDFLGGTFVKIWSDILQFANPILLNQLISFTEDANAPWWQGIAYAIGIFIASELRSIFLNNYFYCMFRAGVRIQSILTTAVYRKTLKLSNSARREKTVGEIVNLMAIDVERFQMITPQVQQYWSSPFQIVLALFLLWQTVGVAAFSGVAIMLLVIPVNFTISIVVKKWQVMQMRLKDERVKMSNEVLNGIKVVKLYAWEPPMLAEIDKIRRKEVALIRRSAMTRAITDILNVASPFLVALVTFTTYTLMDSKNSLTPQIAFVSLTLFNQLRSPMMMVADLIGQTVQAMVSNKRLKEFFVADELDENAIDKVDSNEYERSIDMEDARFSWERNGGPATLRTIDLHVENTKLISVIGTVGSGKSSLLQALLGEMDKLQGYVGVRGSLAYVPQQSWIQNMTLRENILFGAKYDRQRYQKVIEACALKPDFDILPHRDHTEIGEKGINLSGGQKARVSLARAIYQDRDIYLLDDPLSAVDTIVGKHIFEKVIGPNGLLNNKTRILVTHSLSYLKESDVIVIMHDGIIKNHGEYEDLILDPEASRTILGLQEEAESPTGTSSGAETVSLSADHESASEEDFDRRSSVRSRKKTVSRQSSVRKSVLSTLSADIIAKKMIQEEKAETGRVKFSVYMQYFRAMTWRSVLIFALFFPASYTIQTLRNFWLSDWSNDNAAGADTASSVSLGTRLGVFGVMGFGELACLLVALLSLISGGIHASMNLHNPLLYNLLRSPLSFYDVTPLGRILNRLGKDIEVVDLRLSMNFRFLLVCILSVLQTITIIMISTPIFGVVIVPLAVIYVLVLRYFITTSRQLQRLTSISRSPLYSHFSESIQGASSIRAYGMRNRFCKEFQDKVDTHISCKYFSLMSNRWLAVRLEFLGNLIVLFAALFAVLAKSSGTISAGLIGLSVSNSLNVTFMLNFLVRQISDIETYIVSVERISEYSKTPTEATWTPDVGHPPAPALWPLSGAIQIKDYSTRYRPGLDLALKGLNATIDPHEKIGIVGRTGAGKSSMALALFRIVEAAGGQIVIDDVDISNLPLHDLRSKITIIPQDPVLFSGTLRFNLDPFEEYSDADLWRALEHANLKNFVDAQPSKLYHVIGESGENISIGQRQLVCLTRAILRKSQVLVLDEATAAVDVNTDALIQQTIRKEFATSTVLTIAHRLNTIMDYDRVMVLEQGKVVEFETPQTLLANKQSLFYSMAKNAKLVP
ncbi:hypothetical protein QR680_013923 [Steinernema hermaphroditum]|uniref:Multidrug resistance-associated protein 1 n=1 Tax=Steinernema hermaphroditum TaxID=289476 RepID=A0AA39I750_9BILA|nr:hypothetical protein QR680_013923 [Steinernema hermaphroditum]